MILVLLVIAAALVAILLRAPAWLSSLLLVAALRLRPLQPKMRNPVALTKLFFAVFADIIRSNIAVARIILGPRSQNETSGVMQIPLELRAPYGLAALAIIRTAKR